MVTIFFLPKNLAKTNSFGQGAVSLTLDASPMQSLRAQNDITDHPVEEGANISDHIRIVPEVVTIEGYITNAPFTDPEQNNANAVGIVGYAEDALTTLLDIRESGQLVTVATELRTYKDMALKMLEVPYDLRTGDAMRFTATFKRVIQVATQTTQVKVQKEPKANAKKDDGKKNTKQPPEQLKSWPYIGGQYFFGDDFVNSANKSMNESAERLRHGVPRGTP